MEASTVGQLILRMREQAWRIQARTHGAEGHEQLSSQGWAKLAGTAGRVLQLLDADDRCLATLAALQQNRRTSTAAPTAVSSSTGDNHRRAG